MSRGRWMVALAATVLCGGLMLSLYLVPGRALQIPPVAEFMGPRLAAHQGVMQIWQIDAWRTGSSSRTAVLTRAAQRFENAHPGLYLDIVNMTADTFSMQMAAGLLPDLVSAPDGFWQMNALYFQPLQAEGLLAPFDRLHAAQPEALPWMAGMQCVLLNLRLLSASGVEQPLQNWSLDDLLTTARGCAKPAVQGRRTRSAIYGIACSQRGARALVLSGLDVADLIDQGLVNPQCHTARPAAAWEIFVSGNAAALICTQQEAIAMQRRLDAGKGFDYTLMRLPQGMTGSLDVQYMLAVLSGDEHKDALAAAFAQTLAQPRAQGFVAAADVISVLPQQEMLPGTLPTMLEAARTEQLAPLCFTEDQQGILADALGGADAAVKRLHTYFLP